MTAVVLVHHGSSDPRSAEVAEAFRMAVSQQLPGRQVRSAFLDHSSPTVPEVLRELAQLGQPRAVVVPVLLAAAFHALVDLPAALSEVADIEAVQTKHLGVDPLVVDAVVATLGDASPAAVVLAAAGSGDQEACDEVRSVASQLAERLGVRVVAAFASAAAPTVASAIDGLRRATGSSPVVVRFLLAPGRFADQVAADASGCEVTEVLGAAPALVALVARRATDAGA